MDSITVISFPEFCTKTVGLKRDFSLSSQMKTASILRRMSLLARPKAIAADETVPTAEKPIKTRVKILYASNWLLLSIIGRYSVFFDALITLNSYGAGSRFWYCSSFRSDALNGLLHDKEKESIGTKQLNRSKPFIAEKEYKNNFLVSRICIKSANLHYKLADFAFLWFLSAKRFWAFHRRLLILI